MPAYVIRLRVPPGTPKEKPVEKKQPFEPGVITKMEVFFPPGCRGTVYTRCLFGNTQLAPYNKGEAFNGSGEAITWPEFFILPFRKTELIFQAWAPNARYEHEVVWRVFVLPMEIVFPYKQFEALFSRLEKVAELFGV